MMLQETNGVQIEGFIQTSIWLENFAHLWELHPFYFLHCISILKLNTNRSLMDRLMLCQTYICAFHSTQNVTEKWNHGLPIKLMIHSFLNSNLKALPQPMPQTHWVSPRLVTMLQPSEVRKKLECNWEKSLKLSDFRANFDSSWIFWHHTQCYLQIVEIPCTTNTPRLGIKQRLEDGEKYNFVVAQVLANRKFLINFILC